MSLHLVLLCAAPVAAFQGIPSITTPSKYQYHIAALGIGRGTMRLAAAEDDLKSNSENDDVVTDLDKATFDIAKEYAETGIPDDSESSGFKLDTPTL